MSRRDRHDFFCRDYRSNHSYHGDFMTEIDFTKIFPTEENPAPVAEEEIIPEIIGDNELPFFIDEWLKCKQKEAELSWIKTRIDRLKNSILERVTRHGHEGAAKVRCGNQVVYLTYVQDKPERLITQFDVGSPMPGSKKKGYAKIQINEENQ